MPTPVTPASQKTALFLVFITVCVDLLGFGLVLPLLPIYGKELMAVDYTVAQQGWTLGLLMSCYSLMQFLFAPLWGRLSDRIGRRPVLLMSLAGSTCFYFFFGLASQWHSLGWMFVARIGAGIAGATIPTSQAYIADVTTPEKRARGMALIGAAFGLGFTLGPLIGAAAIFLSGSMTLSPLPGFLASGLSGMAFLWAVWKLPESHEVDQKARAHARLNFSSLRQALAVPSIGLLLVITFFSVFSLANFEGTISLAIKHGLDQGPAVTEAAGGSQEDWVLGVRLMGIFAYIGVIQCLVQGFLVRRLADRYNEGVLATTGAVLSIAGFVLLALAMGTQFGGLGLLMVAAAVEVAGIAFLFPAIQSLISRRTDPAEQGGILGAGESINSMARITGVVFGARLFLPSPTLPYWSAAAIMCVILVLISVAVGKGKDHAIEYAS